MDYFVPNYYFFKQNIVIRNAKETSSSTLVKRTNIYSHHNLKFSIPEASIISLAITPNGYE